MQATDMLLDGREQTGVGIYDVFSARLACQYKFDFLWVSSFAVSASLGYPDIGLIDPSDMLSIVRALKEFATVPIVVDLDAGYGDPIKLFHVAKLMAKAGAAAICIEDNVVSKRCSLYDGYERSLASAEELSVKIKACKHAFDDVEKIARLLHVPKRLLLVMA